MPKGFDARRDWLHILWLGPLGILLAAAVMLIAITVRNTPLGQDFLAAFPGHSEPVTGTPVGFPAWLSITHAVNALFLLMIIKTGILIRGRQRPPAFWTRNNDGLLRTKGRPRRLSIHVWLHLWFDVLWIVNGIVYVVLLFATGQWLRMVPTSWDVIPNAISAALQYASLDWPTTNAWVNYNGLQLLIYFVTVFIASPLAIVTGIRLSSVWPLEAPRLNRLYPEKLARAIHFPVMLYFLGFIAVHLALVFATGALRNLNHLYALRDDESWWGLIIFSGTVVVMIGMWLVLRPSIVQSIAALSGKVQR